MRESASSGSGVRVVRLPDVVRPQLGRNEKRRMRFPMVMRGMAVAAALVEKGECDAMLLHMFDPESLRPERVRPLSRGEYARMVELGMFEDERVELLRGVLVTMSPQGPKHLRITGWFGRELVLALGRSWDVFQHSPYAASDDSAPEPDISVTSPGGSLREQPSAAVLVIEVSDSSIAIDRQIKSAIYAEAQIPEYWIVNVSGDALSVEVHTDPTSHGYRNIKVLRDGDVLRPSRLVGVEVAVRDIPWDR